MADPSQRGARSIPALTHVESLTADGEAIDLHAATFEVPSGRRRITLAYAGLSLAVPERVMFRYRLDGFDRDWSEPSTERQAVYTNLSPGPYRFRVIASNSDGLWNGERRRCASMSQPMIWQTTWFRVAALALCVVAGWGLYRLRLLQVARQLNVRFEERLAERTRIAQELHDTLLQGFVSASMQLHVAADRLPADSPARPSLSRVLDLMSRVIEEGRNAVRGLRSSATAIQDLEQAFAGVQQDLVTGEQTALRVVVEGRRRPLNPVIRDEVYRIGREALVNAVPALCAPGTSSSSSSTAPRRSACSCETTAAASIPASCGPAATGTGACRACASVPSGSAPASRCRAAPAPAPKSS